MNDLIPRMSSGQAYTERHTFSVDLDNGAHVGFNFTITNLGIRNGYGAAQVRVRWPGESNYSYGERVSRSNWSFDENRFALDIADTQVEADGNDAFILRHQGDGIEIELRFVNNIPMWQPGNGEIRQGDDYYRFTLTSPRADVTGRVNIGGQWHDVTGARAGYADHVATNVAPYNLAKRFTRFRNYNGDLFVMWREIELTDDYGGQTVSWVVIGQGDQIIFEDSGPTVGFGNATRDSETGYNVPHAVQVEASNGDRGMRFQLRGDDVARRDLLESYGRAARAVASRLSNPFEYTIAGDYALEVVLGDRRIRTTGSSHYTVDFVNP